MQKSKAFTMSEVLITIALIGIVATLVFPLVVHNYQKRQFKTAQEVLNTNLTNAISNMQVVGKLNGYASTTAFAEQFTNYISAKRVCDKDHLSDCFASNFTQGDKQMGIDNIKTSGNLGKSYNDNNVGMVLANKASIIVTYDPGCNVVGMNFHQGMACIGVMYDLNGPDRPNKISEDIGFINAGLKNGVTVAEFKAACEYSVNAYETSINCQCGPACSGMANSLNLGYSGANASSLDVFECACEGSCLVDSNIVTSCSIDD